jgi:mono/diheme cytochrome c family protein
VSDTVQVRENAAGTMASVFRANCQSCHDTDGRGAVVREMIPRIPDFTDPKWQASRTDIELQHSIREGKGRFMPPMKDKLALARTEVKEMAAFVRSFGEGKRGVATAPRSQPLATPLGRAAVDLGASIPVAAPPSSATSSAHSEKLRVASELYRASCLSCHGQDGRGTAARGAMPAIPDFTAREWQSGRGDGLLAVSILDGKGALMPAWRGKVSQEQAEDLVAYIRSFAPPGTLAAGTPTSDFESHFLQLEQQLEELKQQARALFRP